MQQFIQDVFPVASTSVMSNPLRKLRLSKNPLLFFPGLLRHFKGITKLLDLQFNWKVQNHTQGPH